MPKELSEHHAPPLSTRMIFLHHRVRMHDRAGRHTHCTGKPAQPLSLSVWGFLLLFLIAAGVLLGALHA